VTEAKAYPAAARFEDMNVKAVHTYETLALIIAGGLVVTSADGKISARMDLMRPLSDAFIFELWRAYRLGKQAEKEIAEAGVDMQSYFDRLKSLDGIRNVTEHYRDAKNPRQAAIHEHAEGAVALDETSLVVLGPEQVLRGDANLFDMYLVARETTAIFAAQR